MKRIFGPILNWYMTGVCKRCGSDVRRLCR